MSAAPEQDVLADYLEAIAEVAIAVEEAKAAIGDLPADAGGLATFDSGRRLASRALLKSVEQMQDLLGRAMRVTLVLEQVDLSGLSPRAIADTAEKLGMLPNGESWAALVRLRNELVHEYPLSRAQQLVRLRDAWRAGVELGRVREVLVAYVRDRSILDDADG